MSLPPLPTLMMEAETVSETYDVIRDWSPEKASLHSVADKASDLTKLLFSVTVDKHGVSLKVPELTL
jgi:hypothetical protein